MTGIRFILFMLFCGIFIACSNVAKGEENRKRPVGEQSVQVGEHERWFIAERPASVRNHAPLVIILHGGTENMRKTLDRPFGEDWRRLSRNHGFMIIAPNGSNADSGNTRGSRQHWNDYRQPDGPQKAELDDVAFILSVIDWAHRYHWIDKSKVYVTGASNGGMMTYRLLADAPHAFAGGAAFIANLPQKTPRTRSKSPVPLMIVNGTEDPLIKWEGGQVGVKGQQDWVLSVPETIEYWTDRNKTSASPVSRFDLPNSAKDGCRIYGDIYAPRPAGAPFVFVTMDGGGHIRPSTSHKKRQGILARRILGNFCRDINGADLAWDFFNNRI